MKLILFFVISCLAFHNGKGAPATAVYKFVRCNPEDDQANCVVQQTPEMAWSPDLPGKLPASAAQYLEAEPVEDESPLTEKEEDETEMTSEEGESPGIVLSEDGSGIYEGPAVDTADRAFMPAETGSGDSWTEDYMELNKGMDTKTWMSPDRSLVGEEKPAEQDLREDQLLNY